MYFITCLSRTRTSGDKKQQGEGLPQSHFNLHDSYSKKGVLSD